MGPAKNAESQPVRILVATRPDHGLRRLPQTRVDDMESRIAQTASDNLDAAVMAIEADFSEDDAERNFIHRIRSYHFAAPSYRPNTSARAFTASPTVTRFRAASIN